MENNTNTTENTKQKQGVTLKGTVVSNKMQDTAVVVVSRYVKHPKYKKYRTLNKRFKVHDAGNAHKIGDTVFIRETRPISKEKRFVIVEDK